MRARGLPFASMAAIGAATLLASCARGSTADAADTVGASCDPASFTRHCQHNRVLLECTPSSQSDAGRTGTVTAHPCEDYQFCGRFGTKGFACMSTH